MKNKYVLYNLKIESDFPITDLNSVNFSDIADINITSSVLSENNFIDQTSYELSDSYLNLKVKGIALFEVFNGKNIHISYHPDATEQEISLFLLGSCIGVTLFQRNYLPFHSSAIYTNNGCILFTGDSGMGKSTTLNGFLNKGYKMVADDVTAIKCNEEKAEIYPSFPRAKIWQDAADKLDIDTAKLKKIHRDMDKYSRPISEDLFYSEICSPYIIYEINKYSGEDVYIEEVSGVEKIKLLLKNTYRFFYLEKLGNKKEHFEQVTKLEKLVKVKKIFRPDNKDSVEQLINLIEKDFS